MDYSFFAIVDEEDAVVSVMHEKYGEIKAVFREKGVAEEALSMQKDNAVLRIEEVEIVSA